MGSSQTAGRLMLAMLGTIIGYLIFNIGSIFVIDPRKYPTFFIVVTVLGCVGFGIGIYVATRWALKPPRYREAEKIGLLVQGRIVDVAPTGWKHRRARGFSNRITEREYRLQVEINQPNQPTRQVTLYRYLHNAQTPRRNQYLSLKVHPRYPDVVVLATPATE
ncbi:hypothetical protein [Herpetosiphon geysericola]|uniref:DUF3592 domain-containing protein n=1 Tax=Herpetosiphon geysericola TaxID=70996 RepID=A0A0P6YTI5_9CHLR|nr:hypothetical protein [Herpetosiphon geysericola]KPL86823.1 hypothetical protein SE18_12785 [Herpetosiphon geysericola]